MAAGKTTVARLLAGRFERGVHLEGDVFRRSVVSGRVEMEPDAGDEALAQLQLRYRLAAVAADTYREAGFAVVWEDVIAGQLLPQAVGLLRARPLHVVVLLPRPEVVGAREAGRADTGYGAWSIDALYDGFARDTPRLGLWLDTSGHTPDETVDRILATAGETAVW
jgi:hypothetical protein